jgi:hypothetical protein
MLMLLPGAYSGGRSVVRTGAGWLHAVAHLPKKYFLFIFYYIFELKIQSD